MEIQVIDSGYGIEESDRDKLFKMFGMVNDSKSLVKTKGIGLGLDISKRITNKFNGNLNYTYQADIGSNFFFTFEVNEISEEF